jgi:hypothetical protein
MNNEPVAIRYDFDGYGYQYMDSGSGSDWQTRVDGELLYADPACKHGVDDGACKECYQEATEPVTLTQVEIMNALTLGIPLYTHPVKELNEQFKKGFEAGKEEGWKAHKFHHPVKELPTKEDEYWLMVEVLRAKVKEQQAEIEALKELLANEGIVVGHDYLNNCIATMRKAQKK